MVERRQAVSNCGGSGAGGHRFDRRFLEHQANHRGRSMTARSSREGGRAAPTVARGSPGPRHGDVAVADGASPSRRRRRSSTSIERNCSDEERIAFGGGHDAIPRRHRAERHPPGAAHHHAPSPPGSTAGERRSGDSAPAPRRPGPRVGPAVPCTGAGIGGRRRSSRHATSRSRNVGLGPVDVVDDNDERAVVRHGARATCARPRRARSTGKVGC